MLRLTLRDHDNLILIIGGVVGGHLLVFFLLLLTWRSGSDCIVVISRTHVLHHVRPLRFHRRSPGHPLHQAEVLRKEIQSLREHKKEKSDVKQKQSSVVQQTASALKKKKTASEKQSPQVIKPQKKASEKKETSRDKKEKVPLRQEKQPVIKDQTVAQAPAQKTVESQGEPLHHGNDRLKQDQDIVYQEVYSAVLRVWKPPRGIRVTKPVLFRVVLDAHGIVVDTEMIESSGVVAFDVAARRAIKHASYSRTVWNSTTMITFK